jgi:hypothetical protein
MHEFVRNTSIIARREFVAYFSTPLATVFLIIFIALTGAFAFYVGGFFERGQADLAPFFQYHPWLYLLLVPAVAMRLWAEYRPWRCPPATRANFFHAQRTTRIVGSSTVGSATAQGQPTFVRAVGS